MDFGHCVGGTLFNPASLTHGCMGKHCGVKPSWDYRRCTEAKEKPRACRGLKVGRNTLEGPLGHSDTIPRHRSDKARIAICVRIMQGTRPKNHCCL